MGRVDADELDDAGFEALVRRALESLPSDLAAAVANVAIEVADSDPASPGLLGVYRGVPLTRRGSGYVWTLPDRITIYRGALERRYGRDPARLTREVRRVVLHELAHHFGISDERLRELGAY
jgi:predicted Zn-dependent protease with MMP-like domain